MECTVIYPIDNDNPNNDGTVKEFPFNTESNDKLEALEEIFRQFNVVDGSEHISTANLKVRSLSVGDLVKIGDTHYVCAPLGWRKLVFTAGLDNWLHNCGGGYDYYAVISLHQTPAKRKRKPKA